MSKLLMLKGLPASGKTVESIRLIHHEGYKRVSKDDLRAMIDDGQYSERNETLIKRIRNIIIERCLLYNFDVVIDDTNLNPEHEDTFRAIAWDWDADFEVLDLTDVPLEVCIERDKNREDSVGEEVIRDMYERYLE